MAAHRANVQDIDVEDMDGVNTDKLFEALEVEFEDIVDQKSSNDTECLIRLDDGNMDHAKKFVFGNRNYLQDPRDDNVGHFEWIKNLSRLVSSQLSKHKNKKFFCDRKINDCAIRLPSEDDKWLEFDNHCNKERIPFVVYADLVCVLQKTEPDKEDASYTYQRHKVCSVGYYVRCSYDNSLSSYHFRRDENCISWFAR
ncbi:PREDICTED: uncharacterized protein LOC108758506 [Trachymyrmex cornetzi]|uniref:uncharacterized protein LOC108758506 n=1 Tax=Trachymyrmex cornetzi TaxID=471704 RepID=UPI00084F168A|nr:PREDICTED: uncharacterized protein LOC108758506 [Trachymyrmex cornetzi]